MIDKWREGYDIVIMKREEEGHNNFIKKWTEILFYKFLKKISKTNLYYRFAGFALMDKRVVENLRNFKESDPFVRGLISLVGFNHTELYYKEEERSVGSSKYRIIDMVRLAITGITSFSEMPLYLSFYMGIIVISFSFLYIVKILVQALFFEPVAIQGWLSTIIIVVFLGGVQLISIGLLGIYISKIFIETKKRPNYIIAESSGVNDECTRI
jgi:dolichol-phosphate mannosyltransferase